MSTRPLTRIVEDNTRLRQRSHGTNLLYILNIINDRGLKLTNRDRLRRGAKVMESVGRKSFEIAKVGVQKTTKYLDEREAGRAERDRLELQHLKIQLERQQTRLEIERAKKKLRGTGSHWIWE